MSVLNLPKSANGALPFAGGADVGLEGLRAIAGSMAGEEAAPRIEPTTWSQLNVFEAAFRNPDHPGHADAIAQWRGLMSVLALSQTLASRYILDVQTIDLLGGEVVPDVADALARTSKLSLLPGLALDFTVAVITLQAKSYDGPAGLRHPIGFVSPATLVAPAQSAASFAIDALPFLTAEHGFVDPVEGANAPIISTRQRAIVGEYVRGIHQEAGFLSERDGKSAMWRDAANALSSALSDFADVCKAGDANDVALRSAPVVARAWPDHPVLKSLDKTYQVAPSDAPPPSQVVLSDHYEGPIEAVILADTAIAETLNIPAADIALWSEWTLEDITDSNAFTAACESALSSNIVLLRPDDVFCDEALRFESAVAPGQGEALGPWLAPLTATALFLIGPEDIAERLEVEEGNAGGIGRFVFFRLRVPLRAGVDHIVERLYCEHPERADRSAGRLLTLDGEDEYNPPEVLAVWPNFKSTNWRHNFIYFNGNPQLDLLPLLGVSSSMMTRTVFQHTEPPARLRAVRAWSEASGETLASHYADGVRSTIEHATEVHAPWFDRFRFQDEPRNIAEIQRLRGVDALVMTRPLETGERRVCGLLIVGREAAPEPADSDVVVAIDFGTTGTVVHMAANNDYCDVILHDRLHYPARRTVQGGFAEPPSDLFGAFFPFGDKQTPLATVARRRDLRGPAAEAYSSTLGLDEIGFSDSPYFEDDLEPTLEAIKNHQLIYGLKWGPGKRPVAKRFLRQLVLMVSAELTAVSARPEQATWCFSYPDAFSNLERSSFQRIAVQAALDEVFGPEVVEPRMYPESTAVVRHLTDPAFYNRGADAPPFISLDIGGGTTDVVLWEKDKVMWRSSFPMGGQAFLTDIIRQNIAFIQELIPDQAGVPNLLALVNELRGQDGEAVENAMGLVDTLLASDEFRVRFEKNYPLLWDEGPAMLLRVSSATLLCGILWYMGRVTRLLSIEGAISADAAERLTFVLAGRGCQMFRLFQDDAAEQSYLSELCSIFLKSADAKLPTLTQERVDISRQLKREVVYGMLRQAGSESQATIRAFADTARGHHAFMPILGGVTIHTGDEEMEFPPGTPVRALIQGGSMRRGAQITVELLDEFYRFLDALYACAGVRIDFAPGKENVWLGLVQDALHHAVMTAPPRTSEQDSHYIEPPFVAGLRILLSWIARSNAEGNDDLRFHIA